MQIGLLLHLYILNALVVALVLLWAFLSDRSTAKNHKLSWLVICIASALWLIAVPLSIIEVLRKFIYQRRVLSAKPVPQDVWAKK
jgi:RsiW-degrading membrane proteinase PrsW (M82 family)